MDSALWDMYVPSIFNDTEMSQWALQTSTTDIKRRHPKLKFQTEDPGNKVPQTFWFVIWLFFGIPKFHDIAKEIHVFIEQKTSMDSFP